MLNVINMNYREDMALKEKEAYWKQQVDYWENIRYWLKDWERRWASHVH
jgi:hypothetical protein